MKESMKKKFEIKGKHYVVNTTLKQFNEIGLIIDESEQLIAAEYENQNLDADTSMLERSRIVERVWREKNVAARCAAVLMNEPVAYVEECPRSEVMELLNDFFSGEGASLSTGIVSLLLLPAKSEAENEKKNEADEKQE